MFERPASVLMGKASSITYLFSGEGFDTWTSQDKIGETFFFKNRNVWYAHTCTSALECPINVNQVDTIFTVHPLWNKEYCIHHFFNSSCLKHFWERGLKYVPNVQITGRA